MSILDNFDSWKGFLAKRLEQAKDKGMDHDTITNLAHEVGDYLAEHVSAKNKEEAVLKELWNVASEEEQQSIASAMVRLVQKQGNNNG